MNLLKVSTDKLPTSVFQQLSKNETIYTTRNQLEKRKGSKI